MANIAREDNEIVLKLSTGERIIAMHRDVRVPLSAVKSVDVVDEPIRRIQGPGLLTWCESRCDVPA